VRCEDSLLSRDEFWVSAFPFFYLLSLPWLSPLDAILPPFLGGYLAFLLFFEMFDTGLEPGIEVNLAENEAEVGQEIHQPIRNAQQVRDDHLNRLAKKKEHE